MGSNCTKAYGLDWELLQAVRLLKIQPSFMTYIKQQTVASFHLVLTKVPVTSLTNVLRGGLVGCNTSPLFVGSSREVDSKHGTRVTQ